jgi:hypothetical protein
MISDHQTTPDQTPEPGETPACVWFAWIGQPFSSCDRCGRPAWEHRGEETFAADSPFDGLPPFGRPWRPGEADAIKARWVERGGH